MNIIKYKPKPHLRAFGYLGCYHYFVTICTDGKKNLFVKNNYLIEKMIDVLNQTAEKHFFTVWVYCFMPDHLHILVEGINPNSDLKKFIKIFKQRTAYWYSREESSAGNKLWQPGYYDHVLRKEEDTAEVMRYILDNPVRKGLVANYLDYRYSGSPVFDIKEILF
jgi:putative transposase